LTRVMVKLGAHEIWFALLSLLVVAIVAGMLMAWGWLIWRLVTGQPILPEKPLVDRREPPWRGWTIAAVVVTYLAVSLLASFGYHLIQRRLPGKPAAVAHSNHDIKSEPPSLPAKALAPAEPRKNRDSTAVVDAKPQRLAGPPWAEPKPAGEVSLTSMMLVNAVVQLVLLLLVPSIVKLTCGATLRDFGLSFNGWERQAACGVVATLIASPPVYAIQFAVMRIWTPEPHPLMKMMLQEFSPAVGVLAVVSAVMLAPMFEELAFRGLIQRWLVDSLKRSVIPAASVCKEENSPPADSAAVPAPEFWAADWEFDGPSPVVTAAPGEPAQVPHRGWLGIVLTSIFFASVHAAQWPAPIPLFALALVIGTVFYRTGSLIAAIFMHASFNGMSTLMLFIGVLAGQKLGNDNLPTKVTAEVHERVDRRHALSLDTSASHALGQKMSSLLFFVDEGRSDC
jgi:membrane protease YdiL (CAAX protease family)